jgi:hypothetical protein
VNEGPYYYYAAINGALRHLLTLDSTKVRFAYNGAVYLNARGSKLTRSKIDTTGNTGALTTSYAAIALADSTVAESTTVRRSGYWGVRVTGNGASFNALTVDGSKSVGVYVEGPSALLSLTKFTVINSGSDGVQVARDSASISTCDVKSNAGFGITTVGSYKGVAITSCNFADGTNTLGSQNTKSAVNNANTTPPVPNVYVIGAPSNWWGTGTGPTGTAGNSASPNVTAATPLAGPRAPY